jgi:hypothetical protein
MMNGFERYNKKTRRAEFLEDGAGGAVTQAMRADRAGVPEGGQWASSGGSGADAADLLFAAVIQLVGPGR